MYIIAKVVQWMTLDIPKNKEKKARSLAKDGNDIFAIADELGLDSSLCPDDHGMEQVDVYDNNGDYTLAVYTNPTKKVWDNKVDAHRVYVLYGGEACMHYHEREKDWVVKVLASDHAIESYPPNEILKAIYDAQGWEGYTGIAKEDYEHLTTAKK
jgi:hypothetical protein